MGAEYFGADIGAQMAEWWKDDFLSPDNEDVVKMRTDKENTDQLKHMAVVVLSPFAQHDWQDMVPEGYWYGALKLCTLTKEAPREHASVRAELLSYSTTLLPQPFCYN